MYDHSGGKYSRDKITGPIAEVAKTKVAKDAERRGADRHAITAVAEVVDVASGARFSTRTSDLGPGGCFVDSITPFPIGSKVRTTVRKGDTEFEVGGTVVYSQTGLGMGIAFDELAFDQRLELEAWLAEVTGGKQQAMPEKQTAAKTPPAGGDNTRARLNRLVQLLVNKRLLTDSDAASILQDPIL